MLKFFRKIHQNLLTEGKTSKYFKYAIGEIILGLVAILINNFPSWEETEGWVL
jgi:hypothetical protein